MIGKCNSRFGVLVALVGTVLLSAVAAQAQGQGQQQATLATSAGDSINENQLDQWIDSFVPPQANRLLTLTQCFGGNMLGRFAGKSNTTVISATSPGQEAHYGGYDDDAAGATKPAAGTTAQDVHNAGTAGKHASETPSVGGGLPPNQFPMGPVRTTPEIESRHVVVYAGIPDSSEGRDNDQRDTVKSNFAGDQNTTVTTVGGKGVADGYDKPGSAAGLKAAIKEAGDAIRNSPHPEREQFLLFVTDHGDLHNVAPVMTPVPPQQPAPIVQNFPSFIRPDFEDPEALQEPGFSVFIDFFEGGLLHPADEEVYEPFFVPGALEMRLMGPFGEILLPEFEELYAESEDGLIGNAPGEGVRIQFDPGPLGVDSFFDVFYDVELFNRSEVPLLVTEFSQDSGPVAKRAAGDCNRDLVVNDDDLSLLLSNWRLPGATWLRGDMTADGEVDDDDLSVLLANWNGASVMPAMTVPEPGTAAILMLGGVVLARRRRR